MASSTSTATRIGIVLSLTIAMLLIAVRTSTAATTTPVWGPVSLDLTNPPWGAARIVRPASVTPGADASPALQKAIDFAAARHAVVLLAPTTYTCREQLVLPSNTTVYGTDSTSVLHFTWGPNQPNAVGGMYMVNANQHAGTDHDITLANFTIAGGGDGRPAGSSASYTTALPSAVRMLGVRTIAISNLKTVDIPGSAINLGGITYATITHNDFDRQGRSGIVVFPSKTVRDANLTFDDNRIAYVGDDAIAVASTTGLDATFPWLPVTVHIDRNTIESWPAPMAGAFMQGHGIAILGAQAVTVDSNTIHDTAYSGIVVRGSDDPGQIRGPGSAPWLSHGVTITNNRIWDIGADTVGQAPRQFSAADGIELSYAGQLSVHDNTVQASSILGSPLSESHLGAGNHIVQPPGPDA